MRKTVAFGFVGTVLDYAGRGSQRWSKWRPTLCLCQQESLVIDRLELLHDARSRSLFETLKRDIASVSPETEVVGVEIELHNPWDFEEVYACLHDFARGYAFQPEKEDYLIHITTGTHVAQICWFLLAEARYLPARLIQSSPPRKKERRAWLASATSPQATWRGNFRELSASVTRMATFATSGRITLDTVEDEINCLRYNWQESRPSTLTALLGTEAENIDLFDRMQLENVIAVCRQAKSLSAAGRQLFDASRQGKASVNDADRLRKYLARFGLTWETMQDQHSSS